MIASTHFYLLIKMFATIYERLVKAYSLIAEKHKEYVDERYEMFLSVLVLTIGQ